MSKTILLQVSEILEKLIVEFPVRRTIVTVSKLT